MTDIVNDTGHLEARGFRASLNRRLRRQRGLTLIEAATVLAILAFVVAGIMMLYTSADQSRKTTSALSELAAVQQAVRAVYSGQSSYSTVTNQLMIDSNALPTKLVNTGTAGVIRNAFNGGITITPADAGGGAGSGFQVAFANVPKDPCVKMVTSDLGRGTFSLAVGTITRTQTSTPPLPLTLADANTGCAAASANTITWIFN